MLKHISAMSVAVCYKFSSENSVNRHVWNGSVRGFHEEYPSIVRKLLQRRLLLTLV